MQSSALFRIALLVALAGSASAQLSAGLVAQLKDAPTAPQRLALLKDSDVGDTVPLHSTMTSPTICSLSSTF